MINLNTKDIKKQILDILQRTIETREYPIHVYNKFRLDAPDYQKAQLWKEKCILEIEYLRRIRKLVEELE